jgi:hypothetical protein
LLEPHCTAPVGARDDADEKIGIARITLRQPRRGVSVVVAGFFEADRVMLAWKTEARIAIDCEFTVLFTDGALLRGTLPLWCKVAGRPALRVHIRQNLRPDDPGRRQDREREVVDQYGRAVGEAVLDHYAVDEHP